MVDFVRATKIHPVVSRVQQAELDNLAALDSLFEDMKQGTQFGKLVLQFTGSESKL